MSMNTEQDESKLTQLQLALAYSSPMYNLMMRMRGWLFLNFLATQCSYAQIAPIRDLNPILIGFELPPNLATQSSKQPTKQISINATVGNISLNQIAHNEHLQLDAEVQQWQFSWTQPLPHSLSLQLNLPYVRISGGSLDSFIENWHRTFGLPNGNRDHWPQNRLLINYDRNALPKLSLTSPQQHLGDPSLRLGWHLNTQTTHSESLWLSLKLPVGDALNFTGSGSTDLALSFAASQQLGARLQTYQQLSAIHLGTGKRLATQQRSQAYSGQAGLNWQLTAHWQAIAQLDAHTAVYDSDIRALGNALQLSFGPGYQGTYWQSALLISEDIAVDTAPDVQMQLNLTRRY